MEIILEQEEVGALLREALLARGVKVPPDSVFSLRTNHKKGTVRVVFKTEKSRD